jgi:hypothetical protein
MLQSKYVGTLAVLIVVGVLLVVMPLAGLAQSDAGLCPALVEQALSELGQNCDLLDRNSACYGYNRVNATFTQEQPVEFFSVPADRTELTNLKTIETVPLNVDESYWGIAVLNVQANVPNTLPGQAVTFLLLGDVSVENAVAPEDVVMPADPVMVTTAMGANIRSAPTTSANLIGSAPAGVELPADGLSPNGNWLRVLHDSGLGWISREVIDPANDVSSLPIIDSESRTPMQSFYFTTGFGDPSCNQAPPSLLVVQGPNNVAVNITANGADIQIGSTIALMILPNNQLQLIVVSGEAKLGDITIPAGFKISAPLSEDGKTVIGTWENLEPLTAEDLERLQGLVSIPSNLLHYPIILPTLADIQALLDAFRQTSQPGVTPDPNTVEGPAAGLADCSVFRATSPLDGLPYGLTTFYWDPAPGATSYRVSVYNENGALVSTFDTPAPNTNVVGDMAAAGNGFTFSWKVEALVNNQVACSSSLVTMFREAPPPPSGQPSTESTPELTCGDEFCDGDIGEDYYTCPIDCGFYY